MLKHCQLNYSNKRFKRSILSILIIFYFLNIASATNESYYFEQISLKEGLSQSTVKAIYRDHYGLLWVGTKDGLNRYDGTEVRTFYNDPQKSNSLPNDNIFFIVEDAKKNMWIGSAGALCRYDRQTDSFVKESINGQEISFQNVLVVDNFLYFSTATTLYKYDCNLKQWSEQLFKGKKTNVTSTCKMETWSNGNIIIGSRWNGLFICNPHTGVLKPCPFFKGEMILDLYKDSKGQLWISQYGKGVFCFDAKGHKMLELSTDNTLLKCDKVMSILRYRDQIWMATDGNGIIVYSPKNKQYSLIAHEQNNPSSLPVNSILTLYKDSYSNLWLGSIRGGLLGVREVYIQSYLNANLNSTSGLSDKTVLSFHEDKAKKIWIGTDGEGINSYDAASHKFNHYPSTFGKKISGITDFSDNQLLISLYKEGLALFDKRSGRLSTIEMKAVNNQSLLWNKLFGLNVINTSDANIYIADENLYCYSIKEKVLRPIKISNKPEGGIRFYMSPTNLQELIIYSSRAVRSLNLQTKRIKGICQINEALIGTINAVEIDDSGKLWLGMTTGFYSWSPENKKLNKLCSNHFKNVSTLVSDSKGYLWIGSGLELYRFNKKNGELNLYGKADGVNANEYLPKTRLLSQTGDVYIGGVEGFVQINKEIPAKKDVNPTFELLNVQLDGTLFPLENSNESANNEKVNIPWDHTSLLINYFINTPNLQSNKRCRYILNGLNSSYQETNKQSIFFQTLAPGDYTLQLSYELKNNEWSKPIDLLEIEVMPPWWRTWWFYLFSLAAIAGSLFLFRQNAIKKTRRAMELDIQLRERDLSEQKVKFLINISHELRTPLTLIYSPLRRILKEEAVAENLKPTLFMMYKHVKNIRNIINMVLDVRKMEMVHETLLLKPYNVNDWITEISNDFRLEFEAKKIDLKYELDDNVQELNFDADKCEKVLSNLLMNAIKFSEPDTTITIKSELLENGVRISVCDEGCGILASEATQLFTRFYQGNHQKGGTGIGLSYAKTQIEALGGSIGYQPGEKKGSIFWFEIPNAPSLDLATERADAYLIDKKVDLFDDNKDLNFEDLLKLNVLVVEDEPELLTYLKESLTPFFNKVLTASNGEKGLNQTLNYFPDLVISDVMMPKMDGFEMCRSIKTNIEISHIPVILLTALGDDENSMTGYKMGADMYLSKPFGVDLLLLIVSNLFKSRNELKNKYRQPEQHVLPEQITFSNADERFLSKFVTLIEEKLDDSDIDINWLAREMAMGRTSFYTKIKAVTGLSANEFIIDLKIKRAMEMLEKSDETILEIAMKLGFVSQRYFSTVFKQNTGKTPSQYRQEKKTSVRIAEQ